MDADIGVPRSAGPPFARGRLLGVAYLSILERISEWFLHALDDSRETYKDNSARKVSCLNASLRSGTLLLATLLPATPGK